MATERCDDCGQTVDPGDCEVASFRGWLIRRVYICKGCRYSDQHKRLESLAQRRPADGSRWPVDNPTRAGL